MEKLNAFERLILVNNLPQQGNYLSLVATKELGEKIGFSTEEIAKIKLKVEPKVEWDFETYGEYVLEFDLNEAHCKVIKTILEKMDSENRLIGPLMPLCERFMEVKK